MYLEILDLGEVYKERLAAEAEAEAKLAPPEEDLEAGVEAEAMLQTAGKRELAGLAELLVHHQPLTVCQLFLAALIRL